MYRSDHDIIDQLSDEGHHSPRKLANQRYRENVLRLQLRDLRCAGIVKNTSHETYTLTELGADSQRDRVSLPSSDGLYDIDAIATVSHPAPDWQIDDCTNLDGETIKQLNLDLVKNSAEEYGWVRESPEATKRKVGNVAETDLHRLIREFPTNEPLPQQCAHWLRAIAGLHFFPDANHRTGMSSLAVLYETATGDRLPVGQQIERVVLESKLARHLLSDTRFDTLWKRDPLYDIWHRYFQFVLCDDGSRRHSPPEQHLREILNYARERR
ncbi:hypothetical protein [Halovivax cerinus]